MIVLRKILESIDYQEFIGNKNCEIDGVINFDPGNKNIHVIMWVNEKNSQKSELLENGTLICSKLPEKRHDTCNYIIAPNPRSIFKQVLKNFFLIPEKKGIALSSKINSTVYLGKDIRIGENVVIEENCHIGENVSIGHNSVILKNTIIKNNVKIGCNCTIGGVGFGYDKDSEGNYDLIPHLGNVILKEYVEIGNNTCIDRAVLGSTVLSENVKVDNLVHIAHGVQIGTNSLIIADAMIGGSVIIGENVWVAPSSSIINKCTIDNNSLIGMGAVVLKPVGEKEVVIGNPAKLLKKN